jgi:hypothetical protein
MNFLYQKYISSLQINVPETKNDIYLFTDQELAKLSQIYFQTVLLAAFIGGFFIFSYYIPTYFFGFFQDTVTLNIFGLNIPIEYYGLIWCGILTFAEIMVLTFTHLRMTHTISVISGLLSESNKKEVIDDVVKLGTNQKDKSIVNYGLNPYKGSSKSYLFVINMLNIFKAFLSNQLLRFLLQRFLFRYIIKYTLDLIGTPIYMFFNALGTHYVYKDIISTIMGRQIITIYISRLEKKQLNEIEKELIYDTLHLIVLSKKAFNQNHSTLTKELFKFFEIKPVKEREYKDNDLAQLSSFSPYIQKLISDIVIMGFVLDGKISNKEIEKVRILDEKYSFNISIDEMKKAAKEFMKGRGLKMIGIL